LTGIGHYDIIILRYCKLYNKGKKMPLDKNILFGQIAIKKGFLTSERVKECIAEQQSSANYRHIGAICLEKGFITLIQLSQILYYQQRNLDLHPSYCNKPKGQIILGRIAVTSNMVTGHDVNAALRRQAELEDQGIFRKLGEILMENGVLGVDDLMTLLDMQDKKIGRCPCTLAQYNVPASNAMQARCPNCLKILALVNNPKVASAFDPDDDTALPASSARREEYLKHMEADLLELDPEFAATEASASAAEDAALSADETHMTEPAPVANDAVFDSLLKQTIEGADEGNTPGEAAEQIATAPLTEATPSKALEDVIASMFKNDLAPGKPPLPSEEIPPQQEYTQDQYGTQDDYATQPTQEYPAGETAPEYGTPDESQYQENAQYPTEATQPYPENAADGDYATDATQPYQQQQYEGGEYPANQADGNTDQYPVQTPEGYVEQYSTEGIPPVDEFGNPYPTEAAYPADAAQYPPTETAEPYAETQPEQYPTESVPQYEGYVESAPTAGQYSPEAVEPYPDYAQEPNYAQEPGVEPESDSAEIAEMSSQVTGIIPPKRPSEEADMSEQVTSFIPPRRIADEDNMPAVTEAAEQLTDEVTGIIEPRSTEAPTVMSMRDAEAAELNESDAVSTTKGESTSFAELALSEGHISEANFARAREIWKELLAENPRMSIEDVLVSEEFMGRELAESLFAKLGIPVTVCPVCNMTSRIGSFNADMDTKCTACGATIRVPDRIKGSLTESATMVATPQPVKIQGIPSEPTAFFEDIEDTYEIDTVYLSGEVLFGKIAMENGFATRKQILEAARLQAKTPGIKMGDALVKLRYLSKKTVETILSLQKLVLNEPVQTSGKKKLAGLFGKILLKKGWVPEEKLNEVLREKALKELKGQDVRLGQLLVDKGLLSKDQVQEILSEQGKEILVCPVCRSQFNVAVFDNSDIRCRECGTLLVFPKRLDNVNASADTIVRGSKKHKSSLGTEATLNLGQTGVTGTEPAEEIDLTAPGVKKFEKYEIISEIARGGMGIVYKAIHPGLKKTVALKIMIAGENATEDQIRRFYLEAEAAAKLHHPNIVPIHDVGVYRGRHFFTLEFIDGPSLRDVIKKERLPWQKSLRIMKDVCEAMHYAHENKIIHRDLKPANIMIDHRGQPMVMDFGLAKNVEGESRTITGVIMGTPSYMPPEQAMGNTKSIEPRSDVYSLGAVLYEMLTGAPPFEGPSPMHVINDVIGKDPIPPRRFNPKLPQDVETICLVAMEKEITRRYPSSKAMAEDIERCLIGDPIMARPQSIVYKVKKKIKKHRGVSATVAAAVLVLVALVAFFVWSSAQAYEQAGRNFREKMDSAEQFMQKGMNLLQDDRESDPYETRVAHLESAQNVLANASGLFAEAKGIAPERAQADAAAVKVGEVTGRLQSCTRTIADLKEKRTRQAETSDRARKMIAEATPVYDNAVAELAEYAEHPPETPGAKTTAVAEIRNGFSLSDKKFREAYAIFPEDSTKQIMFTCRYNLASLALDNRNWEVCDLYITNAEEMSTREEKNLQALAKLRKTLRERREIEEKFLKKLVDGEEFAQNGDWNNAIAKYNEAINELPDDMQDKTSGHYKRWEKDLHVAQFYNILADADAMTDRKEALTVYPKAFFHSTYLDAEQLNKVKTKLEDTQRQIFDSALDDAFKADKSNFKQKALNYLDTALAYDISANSAQLLKAKDLKIRITNTLALDNKNPLNLVYVHNRGELTLGSDPVGSEASDPRANEMRVDEILPFYIGKKEVTNREYKEFMDAGGYVKRDYWIEDYDETAWNILKDKNNPDRAAFLDLTGELGPATWKNRTFPTGKEDHPVVGVNYYEARAYCKFRGARLPTEDEWEKAASWDWDSRVKRVYPWKGNWDPSSGIFDEPSNRVTSDLSFYGVNDMAGNVFEWTVNRLKDPARPGALRGGAATGDVEQMAEWAKCTSRKIPRPLFRNFTGIRVAQDADLKTLP
jgi:formylglycine-generating enzyme required for sulfatase activity/predicted Ser/Thr protein kinase